LAPTEKVVAIERRERPVAHLDDVGVYGVTLGVELQAENAVPEVEQAGRVVPVKLFALVPQPVEGDVHRVLADGYVLPFDRAELQLGSVLRLVEALVAGFEHILDPAADRDVLCLHVLDGLAHTQQIPGPERSGLVGEAPLHGVIHVFQGVGDLRHPPRRVSHVRQQRVPYEAGVPVFIRFVYQELEPGGEVALLLRLLGDWDLGVLGRMVLEGFEVEHVEDGLALTLVPLVEARAALVAEQVLLQHLLQLLGRLQLLARLILGDGLVEVLGDAHGDVQANLVVEAKRGGLGMPDQGSRYGVYLLDAVAVVEGVAG
jgi:hypothetical protein